MNLRDKLKVYNTKKTEKVNKDMYSCLTDIGGEAIDFDGATIWKFRDARRLENISGCTGVEEALFSLEAYARYSGIKNHIETERLLFLDLETTSLSTGAGSYAFLIGLGYMSNGEFITEQFFMDDYSNEAAILKYIIRYFKNAQALVTFNGKTFDVPLLKNRYRMERVPEFPVDIYVIDLLHPCRRIFKSIFPDCSLATMEQRALGIMRDNDIPGWLIPEVYFSFQKDGETDRLSRVIEHNRQDICSMLLIANMLDKIYSALKNREYGSIEKRSLINLSRHLYHADILLFLDVMDYLGDDILNEKSLFKKYSTALKRAGRIEDALYFWKSESSIFSLIELAKHYEHREADYKTALSFCNTALALLNEGKFSHDSLIDRKEKTVYYHEHFKKRIGRLMKKLN